MLVKMITAILAVVFLFLICEVVWEHVLGSDVRFVTGKIDNRNIWEKVAFSLGNVCDRINHIKEYRKIKLEKEFGGWKDDDIL